MEIDYLGLAAVIEACGEHRVREIHIGSTHILFEPKTPEIINFSLKPEEIKKDDTLFEEVKTPVGSARVHTLTPEKRARIEEQREFMEDYYQNLELEDPVEADRIARQEAQSAKERE